MYIALLLGETISVHKESDLVCMAAYGGCVAVLFGLCHVQEPLGVVQMTDFFYFGKICRLSAAEILAMDAD